MTTIIYIAGIVMLVACAIIAGLCTFALMFARDLDGRPHADELQRSPHWSPSGAAIATEEDEAQAWRERGAL